MENKISWIEIFSKIAHFTKNRDKILSEHLDEWEEYLEKLKIIESTIPTYSYYNYGVDDHTNWLVRIFRFFGRAFLEETEVKNSMLGKVLNLQWVDENSQYFHGGEGKPIADLIDKNNDMYDVKHNSFSFEHAHNAKYILNYENGGTVLLKQQNSDEIIVFTFCKSIKDLEQAYGLPNNFFELSQNDLEEFFGLNNK